MTMFEGMQLQLKGNYQVVTVQSETKILQHCYKNTDVSLIGGLVAKLDGQFF